MLYKRKKLFIRFLSFIFIFAFSLRVGAMARVAPGRELRINEDTIFLSTGQTYQINYTAASSVSGIMWSSSDINVADVSQTGVITTYFSGSATVYVSGYGLNGYISDSCTVIVGSIIPSGDYYISNVASALLVNPPTQDSLGNQYASILGFSCSGEQSYKIERLSNGYYTLKSEKNQQYLGMVSSSATSGIKVDEYSTCSSSTTQWVIQQTASGYYSIKPVSSMKSGYCLSIPNDTVYGGDYLVQSLYTNDTDYKDEWVICPVSNTLSLEGQIWDYSCWAASVRMASGAFMETPVSQNTIIKYVFTGERDVLPSYSEMVQINNIGGATIDEIQEGYNFALSTRSVAGLPGKIYEEFVLCGLLDAGNPVIALIVDSNNSNGHYIVIEDYYYSTSYRMNIFTIYDPAPVGQGTIRNASYSGLINGVSGFSGEVTDGRRWVSSCTMAKGQYLNVINSN